MRGHIKGEQWGQLGLTRPVAVVPGEAGERPAVRAGLHVAAGVAGLAGRHAQRDRSAQVWRVTCRVWTGPKEGAVKVAKTAGWVATAGETPLPPVSPARMRWYCVAVVGLGAGRGRSWRGGCRMACRSPGRASCPKTGSTDRRWRGRCARPGRGAGSAAPRRVPDVVQPGEIAVSGAGQRVVRGEGEPGGGGHQPSPAVQVEQGRLDTGGPGEGGADVGIPAGGVAGAVRAVEMTGFASWHGG